MSRSSSDSTSSSDDSTSTDDDSSVSSDDSSTPIVKKFRPPVQSIGTKAPPLRPAASTAPASPPTGAASNANSVSAAARTVNALYRNPNLLYKYDDKKSVPIVSGTHIGQVVQLLLVDKTTYPPLHYRQVDYWVAALDLFLMALDEDYQKQLSAAKKANRDYKKFTWGNKGELAICFALVMDMLKLLHDKLAGSASRPAWDGMVDQFIALVIRTSKIPTDVLTDSTYQTKYRDWKNGGTRYDPGQTTNNIRFPSAEDRLKKLEAYVRSGSDIEVHSTVVTSETMPAIPAGPGGKEATARPPTALPLSIKLPAGPGPVVLRGKEPPRVAAVKQPVAFNTNLSMAEWYSEFNAVKGGPSMLLMPRDRIAKIPDLLKLGRVSNHPEQFLNMMDLIHRSTVDVQRAFENERGLQLARVWVDTCIRVRNASIVRQLVDRLSTLRIVGWSEESKHAWLVQASTAAEGDGRTANLDWLRAVDLPMTLRPQQWHDMIQRLEAVISAPSPAAPLLPGQKRPREESAKTELPPAQPEIVQRRTAALPVSLRLPANTSLREARTLEALMATRIELGDKHQAALLAMVMQCSTGPSSSRIPVLHDPFALLGVTCVPE